MYLLDILSLEISRYYTEEIQKTLIFVNSNLEAHTT